MRGGRDVVPADGGAAPADALLRGQHADRRRLPGPVRPEQPEHLALCDLDGDGLDRDHRRLLRALAAAPAAAEVGLAEALRPHGARRPLRGGHRRLLRRHVLVARVLESRRRRAGHAGAAVLEPVEQHEGAEVDGDHAGVATKDNLDLLVREVGLGRLADEGEDLVLGVLLLHEHAGADDAVVREQAGRHDVDRDCDVVRAGEHQQDLHRDDRREARELEQRRQPAVDRGLVRKEEAHDVGEQRHRRDEQRVERAVGQQRGPAERLGARGLRLYEGALLFITEISCNYGDSPYKGDWRRSMTEGPRLSRPRSPRRRCPRRRPR